MRITHFISSPASGGIEVYVKDLSIAMAKLGHTMHIIFLSRATEINRCKDFENHYLDDLNKSGVGYSFVGNEARRNILRGVLKIRQHVNDFEPDIVHCHLYYSVFFTMFALKTRMIYTHHSVNLNVPSFLYRFFDIRVSSYIGICSVCTNLLSKVSNKDVTRIDNAVSEGRVIPKINRKKSDVLTVLMVGRLNEQKNYKLIIDVVQLLLNENFIVNIAGEGGELASLSQEIKALKLDGRIKLLGNISNVPQLMHEADIFAMTSAWEGLPISLIEATLTGLPTVVTNVGGCSEVTHRSLNGFVVDSFSPTDFSQALKKLIRSESLRYQLGKNGLNFSGEYKLTNSVIKHISLYKKVLE